MYLRIILWVLLPIYSFAQSSVIGKLVDKNKQPISNAKIYILEQGNTITSDQNGHFSLIQGRNLHLTIEAAGYKKTNIDQSSATDFEIQLENERSEQAIETVVVKSQQKSLNRSQKAVTNTMNLSQRELQKAMFLANLTSQEKLKYESHQIRTQHHPPILIILELLFQQILIYQETSVKNMERIFD